MAASSTLKPPGPKPKRTLQSDVAEFDVSMAAVLRVYFYFFRFARPYYPHLILISALMLVQIPAGQLSAFLVRDITDQALLAVDKTVPERMSALVAFMVAQTGFWLLGDLLWKFRELLNWYLFMRGTFDLRIAFYNHLHRLPMSFLRLRPPGENLFRATSDIMTNHNDPFDLGLMGMVAWTVLPIVETVYTLAWAAFFLSLVDPWLALAVAGYAVPYSLVAHWRMSVQRKAATERAFMNAREVAVRRDSIGGLRSLKSMGKALFQRVKYADIVLKSSRLDLKTRWIENVNSSETWLASGLPDSGSLALNSVRSAGIMPLVTLAFNALLMIYLSLRVVRGEVTVGEWTASLLIVEGARSPIERLVGAIQSIRIWTINGQRVMQTLTVEPELQDRAEAPTMPPIAGAIDYKGLVLEYEQGRRALDGITLSLKPGEVVGFVGPSGAGKTSMINVLLRLYAPSAGSVEVDGLNVRDVQLDSFLGQVALVPQTTFLYDGTIRDNVLFGNPLANDAEIEAALRGAGAGPLLDRLGDGLDYEVGDASTLSGGEKQRVGIARALVRNPRILVLDEATANLDPHTEEGVLETLESLYPGRTVLVVAHRLKAVRRCHRIVVMDQGEIVDEGSHEELLERNPWYRQVYEDQTTGVAHG